jgi:hypothetical protein
MRSPLLVSQLAFFGLAALGCSANVVASPEAADAEATTSSAAFIEVSRTGAGAEASRVVARFARVRGGAIGEQEMDLLRVGLSLPTADGCAVASPPRSLQDPGSSRAVELADVGTLSVEAGGSATTLAARQLPDVLDLVSGVVYTGEASFPARGRHDIHASGRPDLDVPAFSVSSQAPGDLADLRVAGQIAGSSNSTLGIPGSAGVELTWEPGAPDDVVYVDVASRGQSTMRCAFSDAGHGTLPASIIGQADDGTITVHRLHRESFHVRGIDRGEIRFDLAKTVTFTRR